MASYIYRHSDEDVDILDKESGESNIDLDELDEDLVRLEDLEKLDKYTLHLFFIGKSGVISDQTIIITI